MGTAGFDRAEDYWPRQWAEAYVAFAAGEMRPWLHAAGHALVSRSWAGPSAAATAAIGHGNSVPRFHITWGTGPGVLAPFVRRTRAAEAARPRRFRFRHRVDGFGHERNGRRRPRRRPRAQRRAAWREELAEGNRRIRAARAGGHRRLRRHRRRPRSGAQELAQAAGRAARIHGSRRARPRRRPDARDHRERPAPA